MRERIEQLRADELPGGPRTPEGPAPPPPVIRWGAMRRFFGMETEAAREARLQQELVQVSRVYPRNRAQHALTGHVEIHLTGNAGPMRSLMIGSLPSL